MDDYARQLQYLGRLALRQSVGAESALDQYRSLAEKARGDDTVEAAAALLAIADTAAELGASEEELVIWYRSALAVLETSGAVDARHEALESFGSHLLRRGHPHEALPHFLRIVEEKEQMGTAADLFSLTNLAIAYECAGGLEHAAVIWERVLSLWRLDAIDPDSPMVGLYLTARIESASVFSRLGRHQEAESLLRSVLDDQRRCYSKLPGGRWHYDVISAALHLARCLMRQSRHADADELLRNELPDDEALSRKGTSLFASFAQECYSRALADIARGNEPSAESSPEWLLSKRMAEHLV